MKFLKSKEKKKLLEALDMQFGIKELPYLLLETGKGKVRAFSGTMNKEELRELGEIANVEVIGLYFAKQDRSLRLSLDGSMMLKAEIKRSVIELTDQQLLSWFKGDDVATNKKPGVYILRHVGTGDIVGCGTSNGEKVSNHIPRERRIRRS